jgi:hypothetical protein
MKDAKGHGSEARGGSGGGKVRGMPIAGHPYHKLTNDELKGVLADAHAAELNFRGSGMTVPGSNMLTENKYADQKNDAATVIGWRSRGGKDLSQSPAVDVAAQHGIGTSHLTSPTSIWNRPAGSSMDMVSNAAQKRQDDFERNGDKY